MALTANELKEARTAFREVVQVDQRGQFWLLYACWFLNCGIQLITPHLIWMKGAFAGGLVVCLGLGVYRWMKDRRLGTRHASNVELLRILREREPGLADQIGDPFAYKPLLDAWNRRLEKRALLWRLDRFLSGNRRRDETVQR